MSCHSGNGARSPEARFLDAVFEHEIDLIKAGIYYFWDPLAASAIVDRDILQFQHRKLDVVVQYSQDSIVGDPQLFSPTRKDGKPRRALDRHILRPIVESEDGKWTEVCTDADLLPSTSALHRLSTMSVKYDGRQ